MVDNNKNRTYGQPVPLYPMFGTHCRTESFAYKSTSYKNHHIHVEAYLENPATKKWTVRRVNLIADGDKSRANVLILGRHMTFPEAMALMNENEKILRRNTTEFQPLFPEARMMGYAHYRAFAEREGYIFDKIGFPRPRPHPQAIPEGHDFFDADIASADKNIQRQQENFGSAPHVLKTPNTIFVFDVFNQAAHSDDFEKSTATLRALNILDQFTALVENAHAQMQEYCNTYHTTGKGGLIIDAEKSLALAENYIRQLKPYGIETREFESFIVQAQVVCHVLHAQGLYDLMRKGLGDHDQNDAFFKERVSKAVETYKKIDPSENNAATLRNMIVQMPAPAIPASISDFITTYKTHRAAYCKAHDPKPPTKGNPFGGKPSGPGII